ncbi:MAG: ribonuclease III, partial [Alphaproteobacteria bacterium]
VHSGQAAGDGAFERLEFLGDRVLGLAVADMLLERFPHETEGALARRHAALVQREALAEVSETVGLADVATLPGAGDPTAERGRAAVLADTFEAVLGALYLDGGWTPAAAAIGRLWRPLLERAERPPEDAKTRLQEWAQARGLGLPCYRSARTEGPDHAPWFLARVAIADVGAAEATGTSKRAAERRAAEALLARLAPGP